MQEQEEKEKEVELKHNFPSREAWQKALNKAPNQNLLKTRSLGRGKNKPYLPIERQQALQDVFFDEFDVIDENYTVVLNELCCVVKCQGLPSYPNADYRVFTGGGAKPIQCVKGSTAESFPKGKIMNALEYNMPAARATAISKALETVGNIFGRNLGRAITAGYNMSDRVVESRGKSTKKKTKKKSKKKK